MSWGFKNYLSVCLAAQLAISPLSTVSWADDKPDSSKPTELQQQFKALADKVENGGQIGLTDPFHLVGQWVEIYDGHAEPQTRYFLNAPSLEMPAFAYTSLTAYVDQEKQVLVIEAQRGQNEKGENGVVVARQYIPNFDAKAIALDNEILSIVDSKGRLHAIDWGYVASRAFRSPVPVFANLWEPTLAKDLSGAKVSATYVTAGVRPLKMEDAAADAVLPLNTNGELEVNAGDLLVTVENASGKAEVMGVFNRKFTHQRISEGSKILEVEAALLAKDSEYTELLAKEIAEADRQTEEFKRDLENIENKKSDPILALTLQALGKEEIQTLRGRADDHLRYKSRENDWFTLSEWETRFSQIQDRAAQEFPHLSPARLARDWQKFVGPKTGAPSATEADVFATPREFYYKLAAAIGVITLYMASPALIENFDSLKQVSIVNWLYTYGYPSVLKDAGYRSSLIANTVALMGLWPAGVGMSMLASRVLKIMDRMTQNSTSAIARQIRDMRKNWADLTNWQRITSFGMRIYSELILGVWVTAIERVGKQKGFFSALNNGLNPFSRVKPESDIGQAFGLTEPTFLGLNNPFQSDASLTETISKKIGLQSTLKAKKNRIRAHAWLLAAIAVSEQYEIDLSTLLTMENSKQPKIEDLKALLADPKARAEWDMLTEELQAHLTRLPFDATQGEVKEVSTALLKEQYEIAKQGAERLAKMSGATKVLKQLKSKFKKYSLARLHDTLNLGRENFSFLKTIYTDKFVSSQVEREFGVDHMMMVYLVALFGDRADLSQPNLLAANDNPWALWTTPQHWNDVGINTYTHYFVAGARMALVYQAVRPMEETTYRPAEDFINPLPLTRQGFFKGAGKWLIDVVNPMKGDFGGISWQTFKRQVSTVQAYLIMNVLLRLTLGQQNFHDAAFGSAIVWMAQTWYIGWIWYLVQNGNRVQGEYFEEITNRIVSARRHMDWAQRQTDPELAKKYRQQGVDEMLALYKELKPKVLKDLPPPPTDEKDLAAFAKTLYDLSATNPPQETAPNTALLWSTGTLAAVVSTVLAIPMSIMSFDPGSLNWETLAKWTAIHAGLTASFYWAYGREAWSIYLEKLDKLFTKGKATCRSLLGGKNSDQEK